MNRMIHILREAPKGALTALLLTLLAAAWFAGSGFAPNTHVPETAEDLYLPSGSPLAAVFDGLASESAVGFAPAAGRAVHLYAAGRFVAAAAPAAIADPAAEEFLVRLYMFASELAAECDRRRVDPAPLRHALDAMAEALRVDGGAAVAAASEAAAEAPVPPAPEREVAEAPAAIAAPVEIPSPAEVVPPAAVAAAPKPAAERPKASRSSAAEGAAVAKRSSMDGGGRARSAAPAKARGKEAPRELAALITDDVAPDHILKASDYIVRSLDVDYGFLVR